MATFKYNLSELRRINANLYAVSRERGLDPSDVSFAQLHELWANITGGNYQTKSAVPSDTDVTVTPDAGYDALAKVLVEAAGNLQPHNIRKGITIFGKEGTMEVAVSSEVPDDFKSNDPENPDPGTIEDADRVYRRLVRADPPADKFLLVDTLGNITYGYMEPSTVTAAQYGGVDLPPIWTSRSIPNYDVDYAPYVTIFYDSTAKQYDLYRTSVPTYFNGTYCMAASFPYRKVTYTLETDNGQTIWDMYSNDYKTDKAWAVGGSLTSGKYTLIYHNYDIYNADGTLYRGTSQAVEYPTGGFTIKRYDAATTEFAAVGWRRLSYHVDSGEWVYDDFTATPSTGWNYLKHLMMCTRDTLQYRYRPIWPKEGTQVESVAADMTAWTKNVPAQSAFTSIAYDRTGDENICQYTGVGMFEYIGFTVKLTMGKTYIFALDYACPSGVTGEYANPYAPYFGFFPTSVLSSDADAYGAAYSARKLPVEAIAEAQTFACTYTPIATMTVAAAIGLGSTLDGVATEFRFKNMALWELPQNN